MRMLIAIAFGCALAFGVSQAASAGATAHQAPAPAVEDATDTPPLDTDTSYECKYSPYCQRDSQCTAYCGGGDPVCFQGCCYCAS